MRRDSVLRGPSAPCGRHGDGPLDQSDGDERYQRSDRQHGARRQQRPRPRCHNANHLPHKALWAVDRVLPRAGKSGQVVRVRQYAVQDLRVLDSRREKPGGDLHAEPSDAADKLHGIPVCSSIRGDRSHSDGPWNVHAAGQPDDIQPNTGCYCGSGRIPGWLLCDDRLFDILQRGVRD